MTYFCTSCQITRTILPRSGHILVNQSLSRRHNVCVFSRNLSARPIREFSVPSLNFPSRGSAYWVGDTMKYHRNTVIRRSDLFTRKITWSWLLSSVRIQGYCTKPLKTQVKSQKEREVVVEKSKEGGDGLVLKDETLTEEERQLLIELEEEEQWHRERALQIGKNEDNYNVWDDSYKKGDESSTKLSGSMSEGHVPFQNRQRIIQDVIDEMWNPLPQVEEEEVEAPYFPRGKTGVFDLGELVDLLKEENAKEVVAITIPKELDYADHMVIVTVGNDRHLVALADFVRKRFKMKDRKPTDRPVSFDKSIKHHGWIALDMGNIILQIFLQEMRDYYDLEMLWTVGPLYDDLTNTPDSEIVQLLNSIS